MLDPYKRFISHLDSWVRLQKNILESCESMELDLKNSDRLSLVIATRSAFQHMIRTLNAFDQWLQDPFIVNHMPREMILEVWGTVWNIFKTLLKLDIKHTSEYKDYLRKLLEEGKVSPLLAPKIQIRPPSEPSVSTTTM